MKKIIASYIMALYKLHEYEISKDKLKALAEIIYDANPSVNEKTIKEFFRFVKQGQYGVLYRVPTSLTSMYYMYRKDNRQLPHVIKDDFGLISEDAIPMPDSFKEKFGIQ